MHPDLRLADIHALLLVERLSSITAAARHLAVTPSQVSKAVARIEAHLGTRLLRRCARGTVLSEAGQRVVPKLQEILAQLRAVGSREDESAIDAILTLAAPSYLNLAMLPVIAEALPGMRVRCLELPPSLVRTLAGADLFAATLLMGEPRLPAGWTVTKVGSCRKSILASPRVVEKLGCQPVPAEKLLEFSFIGPVFNVGGQFVPVDDDCPIPPRLRRRGHEAQTIGVALELAARSEQLVFGPAFAAGEHLRAGSLIELEVEGWSIADDVYFGCNAAKTLRRVQRAAVDALRAAFAGLDLGTRRTSSGRPRSVPAPGTSPSRSPAGISAGAGNSRTLR